VVPSFEDSESMEIPEEEHRPMATLPINCFLKPGVFPCRAIIDGLATFNCASTFIQIEKFVGVKQTKLINKK
jgi:hypothetical protein